MVCKKSQLQISFKQSLLFLGQFCPEFFYRTFWNLYGASYTLNIKKFVDYFSRLSYGLYKAVYINYTEWLLGMVLSYFDGRLIMIWNITLSSIVTSIKTSKNQKPKTKNEICNWSIYKNIIWEFYYYSLIICYKAHLHIHQNQLNINEYKKTSSAAKRWSNSIFIGWS